MRTLTALLLVTSLGCGKKDDADGGGGGSRKPSGKGAAAKGAPHVTGPVQPYTGKDLSPAEYAAMAAFAVDAESLLTDFRTDPKAAQDFYDGWVAVRMRADRVQPRPRGAAGVTHRGSDGSELEAMFATGSNVEFKKGSEITVVGAVSLVAPNGSFVTVTNIRYTSR